MPGLLPLFKKEAIWWWWPNHHHRPNYHLARINQPPKGAIRSPGVFSSAGEAACRLVCCVINERAPTQADALCLQRGDGSITRSRLKFAQPCLNVRKKVRISAMGTTEWGDVTRQGGEALHVQINARVDLVSGCWANKFQWRHYKPSCVGQKKKPRPGDTGASFGSFGGNQ